MTELAKANLNDDDTIEALQQLADEHGSKADAIRHAIRQAAGSDAGTDDDDQPKTVCDRLSDSSLRKALRCLWSISRGRDRGRDHVGHMSADAAMSVLAQEFAVNKTAVKPMYLDPLNAADMIDVNPGAEQTIIYVVDPDAELSDDAGIDTADTADTDGDEATDDADADAKLADINAADPVRADGGIDDD